MEDREYKMTDLALKVFEDKAFNLSESTITEAEKIKLDLERKALLIAADVQKKRKSVYATEESYNLDDDPEEHSFVNEILRGKQFKDKEIAQQKSQIDPIERQSHRRRQLALSLRQEREALPMFKFRDDILSAVNEHPVLIVEGQTGSGKTTQLPQYLLEAGFCQHGGLIGCTQPRRVAAMSVAARVADEMGTKLGQSVGYSIRFEDCTSEKTILKYMTDGMLLKEMMSDPALSKYSVIVVDEAHERTLNTDVLFGLLKDLCAYRQEQEEELKESGDIDGAAKMKFKLIIASATLNAVRFSEYFGGAPIFRVPGRKFPVHVQYLKQPEANYLQATAACVLQIHSTRPLDGDVLAFLPGQQEIEEVENMIREMQKESMSATNTAFLNANLLIVPIYANLPTEQQSKIFEPTPEGTRKIVLATNIAETSITIDNIVYVIDPGYAKEHSFNPSSDLEALTLTPISQAAAWQRTGRAGRVKEGFCFRLYTEYSFEKEMTLENAPEIQRTNLSSLVLTLKGMGVDDLLGFEFLDPPPVSTLQSALENLYSLGALDVKGNLTKNGRLMAELPLEPQFGRSLIEGGMRSCVDEVAMICAMLNVGNSVFFKPVGSTKGYNGSGGGGVGEEEDDSAKEMKYQLAQKHREADAARKNFCRDGGDHLTLLNVFMQFLDSDCSAGWCKENYLQYKTLVKAKEIYEQLFDLIEKTPELNEGLKPPVSLVKQEDGTVISQSRDTVKEDMSDEIIQSFLSGFFSNAARLNVNGKGYTTIRKRRGVDMHPSSTLFETKPCLVIYAELVLTTKEFMRSCLDVRKPQWLIDAAPHLYNDLFQKDPSLKSILNKQQKMQKKEDKKEEEVTSNVFTRM